MKLSELCPVPLPKQDLTHEVIVGADVNRFLPDVIENSLGSHPLVLADPETLVAADLPVLAHDVYMLDAKPHADEATAAEFAGALDDRGGVVAVGSGTINDIAKRASSNVDLPYIIVGTAASMNGYASGIAAMLNDGLKTTVPARPPRTILLDTTVLARAPASMTQAGLGDLMSKPVSDTDWWLANALEGTGYSDLPSRVVEHAMAKALGSASGLLKGRPEAHGALGEALVLSGVAMVVAGSSAPASGGEHLVSHLWDMERLIQGAHTRLHGAQVGVATCISAAIYQRLLRLEKPRFQQPPEWSREEKRIASEFGPLAEVVLPQAKRKHQRAAERVSLLRDKWSEIRSGLAERKLPTPFELRSILAQAGAPSTLQELSEDRSQAARVLRLARDIRDRVTVLDLAFELGLFPSAIDDILNEAGV